MQRRLTMVSRIEVFLEGYALTNNNSQDTLEYEDPSPPVEARDTVHLHDATREQASKSAGSGCRGEEDRDSQSAFMAAVPKSDAGMCQYTVFHRGVSMETH